MRAVFLLKWSNCSVEVRPPLCQTLDKFGLVRSKTLFFAQIISIV